MKGNIPCVPLDPTQTHLPHMCSCLGSTGKAKMQTVSPPGMPLTQGCMLLTVVCRIAEWAREHVWLMCEPWGFLYNISCRDHSNDVIAQRTGISTNMSVKTNRLSVGLLEWMFKTHVSSTKLSNFLHFNLTLLVQSHSSHRGSQASADSFSSAQQNLVNCTLPTDDKRQAKSVTSGWRARWRLNGMNTQCEEKSVHL